MTTCIAFIAYYSMRREKYECLSGQKHSISDSYTFFDFFITLLFHVSEVLGTTILHISEIFA